MASMVDSVIVFNLCDFTKSKCSFSCPNWSEIQVNINNYAICARFNYGPGGAASKYHLACVELEQVPENWTCISCMSLGLAEASNGSDDVNCHVNFLI